MNDRRYFLFATLALCAACLARTATCQDFVLRRFPQREDVGILCWSIPEEKGTGYLSQIVVYQADRQGIARELWRSPLDHSYSPRIRFVPEITVDGLPLALVERQTGAASSQLDVIGKDENRIRRLLQIEGFRFDVGRLGSSKLPFLIAHTDASILDVPVIYRWVGNRFEDDSNSHPDYYRQLLSENRRELPPDSSAPVLLNLSRIAVLAGDRAAAKAILEEALARERSRGAAADPETLRLITQALHTLAPRRP